MIKGMENGTLLDQLAASKFEFHLVGSRAYLPRYYFGDTTYDNRDYDFCVQDPGDTSLTDFLQELGFGRTIDSAYLDNLCIEVWEKDDVDIQIRRDVDWYLRAFDLYRRMGGQVCNFVRTNLTPMDRTSFWNVLFDDTAP